MATIEQYRSGEAAKAVRLAYEAMQSLEKPLVETRLREIFDRNLKVLLPLAVNENQAVDFIEIVFTGIWKSTG
jgi:hypothetical protein